MKILVINCGSSSLKYQLIDMTDESVICSGICDRIGNPASSSITYKTGDRKFKEEVEFPTHTEAFNKLVEMMTSGDSKVIEDKSEIDAIGHRIVQGAEFFKHSELVDEAVINKIDEISPLAPVHNPAHVQGLRCAERIFGSVPNVVVFDTTFHQTMPPKAYMFGIPYEYYEKYHIRRYGAHGTSHKYVAGIASELMGRKDLKIVTCHLGNGSSISAVKNGVCIDTSMGLTPLGGVTMGTRTGDLDPSVVCEISRITGLSGNELSNYLNKQCGFLGMTKGFSSDKRDLELAVADPDDPHNYLSTIASDVYDYQIKKYIGAYAAAMGGIDCLVFTGGIGENDINVRKDACEDMEFFGIKIDLEKNNRKAKGEILYLSVPGSRCKVYVIPTNEELAIARETQELVNGTR
ncbi:MAG: acetate kinase [Clostridia bacterium]|nr:acetate kinase [Clostridia bacterium]